MLVISNVSKRFPGMETFILKDINFIVNGGERVGLIGPNGTGKSTLLHMIMGFEAPTTGSITFNPPDLRLGYLAQGIAPDESLTVEQVLFPDADKLSEAEKALENLAQALADGDESTTAAYDKALETLITLSERVNIATGQRMMAQLNLGEIPLDTPVSQLSGGQKTRLMLASILVQKPQLLIMDEPTNHLDVHALAWLENWLLQFEGGVLVVSHDRKFIDNIANRLVIIDPETNTARTHVGDYESYIATLQHERDVQWAQWRQQEDFIARMQADVERVKKKAMDREKATQNDFQRGLAKKVARLGTTRQKRLEKYIDSDERVERPTLTWDVKMEFNDIAQIRDDALRLENLSIGYDEKQPILENLNAAVRGGERIAIMGPNGHGKSTLLKTIIGELQPLSGNVAIGGSVKLGYLAQEQDILNPNSTALATIQKVANSTETEARAFLHFFLFAGDDPLRPVSQLSYGERTRLMLARLVAGGANLLVMDEPLNHLDLSSREQFEQALFNFPGSVLAVAHDRYFVEQFASTIWHIEEGVMDIEVYQVNI